MIEHLLILPKYTRRGASSRLRLFQFLPTLKAAALMIKTASLLDDGYIDALYGSTSYGLLPLLRRYFSRLRTLLKTQKCVPLLIQGELFPWLPAGFERLFLSGRRYALDLDDAIFHRYDLHRFWLTRMLLSKKIDKLMANASLVIAGNTYLADRALNAGARNVEILPTVVETHRYALAELHSRDIPFRIGWIGTPITWATFGKPLFDYLRQSFSGKEIEFVVIGAKPYEHQDGGIRFVPWSEERESQLIGSLSVGLMPLEDTPWARGKCAYKLVQYLACGVPVVASPVGANCQLVMHGINGFLASTPEDWRSAIAKLAADRSLVRRMGLFGREQIEKHYSVNYAGPRLAFAIKATFGLNVIRTHPLAGDRTTSRNCSHCA